MVYDIKGIGTEVRASFFKPTPIIYLVFEKNDLFIYLIEQNIYFFMCYSYTLFAVCKQRLQIYITVSVSELTI